MMVLLVLILFINVPLVSALQISNVRVEEISDDSATVKWDTDEPANSFINYGEDKENLERTGDAREVLEHQFTLSDLNAETTYYYSVESGEEIADNDGNYHSFETESPDTSAPELFVELPEMIRGTRVSISGTSEPGIEIKLYLNDELTRTVFADSNGNFTITEIYFENGGLFHVKIEAVDASGNLATFDGVITADGEAPTITLEQLPEITEESTLTLKGSISENVSIEILVNDRSVAETSGSSFEEEIQLSEGENIIQVVATDSAGWEVIEEVHLESDTQPPSVSFELVSGTEYYEFLAETDIEGETEPGADVYLFVFDQRTSQYTAPFTHSIEKVTADENGNFKFEGVSFPPPPFSSLEELAPREVPSGLQEILISPLGQIGDQQRKSFQVYVIAEDKVGRVGAGPPRTVNVNSCSSGGFAFDITPITQFQAPFRLDPGLMEDGREAIQAVFNLSYRGNAMGQVNPATNEVSSPYRISSVQFQKACTQAMAESEDYAVGCKLLPASLEAQANGDNTAFFVTGNLQRAADFVEKDEEDSFWDDFQRRQIKFPLKIVVRYSEYEQAALATPQTAGVYQGPRTTWSSAKTQAFCYDLTYSVDVPIDSKDMIPDEILDVAMPILNGSIDLLEKARPFMEKAMMVAGVSCIGSFITKMVISFYRKFMSRFEPWMTKTNENPCPPDPLNPTLTQEEMYLKSTVEKWKDLRTHPSARELEYKVPDESEMKILDDYCPSTAGAWTAESTLDQFYRWTCDRFFCREVPARWTEKADFNQVQNVINTQKQCATTANGIFLEKVENCQSLMHRNNVNVGTVSRVDSSSYLECYRSGNELYYVNKGLQTSELKERRIKKLTPVDFVGDLHSSDETLLAYTPPRSDRPMVGVDTTCDSMCKRNPGYQAATDGFALQSGSYVETPEGEIRNRTTKETTILPDGSRQVITKITEEKVTRVGDSAKGKGCYKEVPSEEGILSSRKVDLVGQGDARVKGTKYSAGYTRDCFVEARSGDLYQCVCEKPTEPEKALPETVRTALKKEGNKEEDWIYRQDLIFKESRLAGTYYPEWRYYSGRDLSGAFGMDYGLDNANNDNIEKMTTTTVNPHTQTLGTFQSLCIPGINARLELLHSILTGVKNCLEEAKYTGLHDAGMCKTIFTQYVCGLIYKVITLFSDQCSPLNFKDILKGIKDPTEGGAEAFAGAFFGSIDDTIGSSISQLKSDYGNAHMEQFFQSGTKGFAESICLMAFGYDFPMGMDFIMDAAYAFPMATNVLFPIASRELSTFNPVKGTATYNYNIAGTILPGCSIRGYRTSLKCVGPEDLGHPNVECIDQPCDCLAGGAAGRSRQADPAYAGERTWLVEGGNNFAGLTRSQMHDIPIESPQKVSSNYRYDHIIVELTLDTGESPESCFDEGYRTSNGGIFYFPITDIQVPTSINCYVDGTSGRFICPEVSAIFGSGSAYFEHPSMDCYDKKTSEFVDCTTPNLFLLNDEIAIRPHLRLGEESVCLRITDTRGQIFPKNIPLPEGLPGPYSPKLTIGSVTNDMIAGSGTATIVLSDTSDQGCGGHAGGGQVNVISSPLPGQTATSIPDLTFKYIPAAGGTYTLEVPQGVELAPGGRYILVARGAQRFLQLDGRQNLQKTEIDQAVFIAAGYKFNMIFGNPTPKNPPNGVCRYQIRGGFSNYNPRSTYGGFSPFAGVGGVNIRAELYQRPGAGTCAGATVRIPRNNLGKNIVDQRIQVQKEPIEVTYAAGMHEDFIAGRYNMVIDKAQGVVSRQDSSLDEAIAIYYWIASLLAQNDQSAQIVNLLRLFFERQSQSQQLMPFPTSVTQIGEYKKVFTYLCEVDKNRGPNHQSICTASLKCPGFNVVTGPNDPHVYKCLPDSKAQGCERTTGSMGDVFPIAGTTVEGLCSGSAATIPAASPVQVCAEYTVQGGPNDPWMYRCLGDGKAQGCKVGQIGNVFPIAGTELDGKCPA